MSMHDQPSDGEEQSKHTPDAFLDKILYLDPQRVQRAGKEGAAGSAPHLESLRSRIDELEQQLRQMVLGSTAFSLPQATDGDLAGSVADNIDRIASTVERSVERTWSRTASAVRRIRLDALREQLLERPLDPFGFDPHQAGRWAPLVDWLFTRYFRVEVRGVEHIPDHGRVMLVSNHGGIVPYDGLLLSHAVEKLHPRRRRPRILAEDSVYHFPYIGTWLSRLGHVRACRENAERLLNHDQIIGVFPEGSLGTSKTWSQRYRLQRFGRGGFIKMAEATDTTIIPVAITGSEDVHPLLMRWTWLGAALTLPYIPVTPSFPWLGPLGLLPLPAPWTITFGSPIRLPARPPGQPERVFVQQQAERVRSRVQIMVNDARRAKISRSTARSAMADHL